MNFIVEISKSYLFVDWIFKWTDTNMDYLTKFSKFETF